MKTLHFALLAGLALGCKGESSEGAPSTPAISSVPAPPVSAATPTPAQPPPMAAASGAPASPACARMCRVGERLKCGVSQQVCEMACASMTRGVCPKEIGVALECFSQQPIEHWECGPEGLPVIKSGYCEAEQAASAACAQHHEVF